MGDEPTGNVDSKNAEIVFDIFKELSSELGTSLLVVTHDTDFAKRTDRIIEMAWEDRTPFDAITFQFGLAEADVKALMKKELKWSSYKLWRTRVENCKTKHSAKRSADIDRFKCTRQRSISNNKISKR